MIPQRTREIVGTTHPVVVFDREQDYLLEGYQLAELEFLMRRLGTEQRMDGEEMRDWMNRLHSLLRSALPWSE